MAYGRRGVTTSVALDMPRQDFGDSQVVSDENVVSRSPVTSTPSESKAVSSPQPPVVTSAVGLIHVLGYTPGEGEQGVPITANINFTCNVGSAVRVRLIVGRRAIATQVHELADQMYGKWQVEGTVPLTLCQAAGHFP